ncbi:MAG: glycosyltransferase family 4 protein [Anaerolineales bacterium]|nr:glycosyltransferase family 4 protein [Anaerolineales bacterium]
MPSVCIFSSVHSALDNRLFYREAQSLARNGFEVTLIAIHPQTEHRDGIQIIGLPHIPRWQRPRLWLTILHLARRTRADIYHFHDPELLLVSPILRLLTRKPVIYDIHEAYPDFIKVKDYMPAWLRYPLAWLFRILEPLLARLQSGLIFSDDAIAETFASLPLPKETLFNFPGRFFVDQGIQTTQAITHRSPIVLHLGGHERNRGTRLMIAAFEQILREIPLARLLLVGHFMPPSLEEEVLLDIHQRGIQQSVSVIGRVPFDTIGNYLSQAAVGWVPWQPYTKNDKNIPTKLFEYMSYAVPIVSSDLRSTRPFVRDGENGLLVDPSDPSEHAIAILEILQDPPHGEAMGRHGQELARTVYNWDAEEIKLLAFYKRLLGFV